MVFKKTLEKTNWVTNSTALSSSKGITPFVGVSMVQTDENKVFSMDDLRRDERLHSHPNLNEKRQTELYMITSGAAALIVVKEGKPQIRIIKEGDLAVVGAGVSHCVAGVLGEYEHIVAQVPSAFQYGYGFKLISEPPIGYDDKSLKQESVYALSEARTLGLI